MKSPAEETLRFGDCELDLSRRELRRGGAPCHLTPRAFTLIELLVRERPRAVSKADLRTRLWPETYVSNTALAQLVTELRKAIGDDPRAGRWIRTVFGFGYAFAGAVEETLLSGPSTSREGAPPETGDPRPVAKHGGPPCWLRWRHQDLPLAEGVNVVGRGREADVRVGVPEVSRRHARIEVDGARVVVEDLHSRNGTFVRGQRVHRPTPLADGDEVAFGLELLVFCLPSDASTTRVVRKRRG